MVDTPHRWPGDPAATYDGPDPIWLKTAAMEVQLGLNPCRLTLLDRGAHRLLWEPAEGGVFVHDPSCPGPTAACASNTRPASGSTASRPTRSTITTMPRTPAVQGPDSLLRNGRGVKDNTYQAYASTQGGAGGPLVWTTAGYGLLVDSDNGYFRITDDEAGIPLRPSARQASTTAGITIATTACSIISSPARRRRSSPRSPRSPAVPPCFPAGPWASPTANGAATRSEFYRIIDNYRARDIPIDNFTFDYDWKSWGEDHYGEFRWNGDKFPDAYKPAPDGTGSLLKANAAKQGLVMTGIMKPRIVLSVNADGDQPRTEQAKAAADVRLSWRRMPQGISAAVPLHPRAGLHQAGVPPMVLGGGPRPRRHSAAASPASGTTRPTAPPSSTRTRPSCSITSATSTWSSASTRGSGPPASPPQRPPCLVHQPKLLPRRPTLRLRHVVGRYPHRLGKHSPPDRPHAQRHLRGRGQVGHGLRRVRRRRLRPGKLRPLDPVQRPGAHLPRPRRSSPPAPALDAPTRSWPKRSPRTPSSSATGWGPISTPATAKCYETGVGPGTAADDRISRTTPARPT